MASLHRPCFGSAATSKIPLFLAPAFAGCSSLLPKPHTTPFSTTAPHKRGSAAQREAKTKAAREANPLSWLKRNRLKLDRNKQRGVSAIRRTGPRSMRGLWDHPLPVPVARDHKEIEPEYLDTQDHGLWGFFDSSKKALLEPDEEISHGRAWEYKELSWKSYEDLHKLYWICVKEQNRCLTREKERARLRAGFGDLESEQRLEVVRSTMKLIREVLVNRQLSFDQATALVDEASVVDIFAKADQELLEKHAAILEEQDVEEGDLENWDEEAVEQGKENGVYNGHQRGEQLPRQSSTAA